MPKRLEAGKKSHRVNIMMSSKAQAQLDTLREEAMAGSNSEVVRRSLDIYTRLRDLEKDGSKLIIRDVEGNEKELIFI